jgi:16S rRNA processing protein RimM
MGSRPRGNDDGGAARTRVCMGVVGAPHGVRGAVRIKSFTDTPEAIASYGALEDESAQRQFTLRVVGTAKGDGMVIATLSGIADRDRAETLRGLRLYAPRAALPPPAPLGQVIAVHDFGAGDMLEIARDMGAPVLVPFTRAVVPVVDLAGRRVVIDPPDGLFDPPRRERAERQRETA